MRNEGNNFAANLYMKFLSGGGAYKLSTVDKNELKTKSSSLRSKITDEAIRRNVVDFRKRFAKNNCCPKRVSIYIASRNKPGGDDVRGSFDYPPAFNGIGILGNGLYPDGVWHADENNLDLFIAIGGVGFVQSGAGTLVGEDETYCDYSASVMTVFDDSFSFKPTAAARMPTMRLRNRYYNAAHYLQVTAGATAPVTWSALIIDKYKVSMKKDNND